MLVCKTVGRGVAPLLTLASRVLGVAPGSMAPGSRGQQGSQPTPGVPGPRGETPQRVHQKKTATPLRLSWGIARLLLRILACSSSMFHVHVVDFFDGSQSTLVYFQVSGLAQRRT